MVIQHVQYFSLPAKKVLWALVLGMAVLSAAEAGEAKSVGPLTNSKATTSHAPIPALAQSTPTATLAGEIEVNGIEHPEFWGWDLQTIAGWHHANVILQDAFQGANGAIILRLLVYLPDKRTRQPWDVDLFKRVVRVPSNPREMPSDQSYIRIKIEESLLLKNGQRILWASDKGGPGPCGYPFQSFLVAIGAAHPELDRWLITKEYNPGRTTVGGLGCDAPTKTRTFFPFAAASADPNFVPLRDGTFLVLIGLLPSQIIRLDENLDTMYRSNRFVMINERDFENLFDQSDVISLERNLISLFH
jgi:hypothetical protein